MEPKDFQELQAKITYLADVHEIQQLQHRYIQNLALFRADKVVEMFARKTPGVTFEGGGSGLFEGIEGVARFFSVREPAPVRRQPGSQRRPRPRIPPPGLRSRSVSWAS